MLKLILVLRNCPARKVVHTFVHTHPTHIFTHTHTHTHTHTQSPPPLSFENCQRTLWLLVLLLVLGQEPVFCPELHLMISVCPIDGLRLCAERDVRLVTVPRGESAPALCVLVRGGRTRPVRSCCCRDDVPAPAPVWGSLLGS